MLQQRNNQTKVRIKDVDKTNMNIYESNQEENKMKSQSKDRDGNFLVMFSSNKT